jgi:hypothetical protein
MYIYIYLKRVNLKRCRVDGSTHGLKIPTLTRPIKSSGWRVGGLTGCGSKIANPTRVFRVGSGSGCRVHGFIDSPIKYYIIIKYILFIFNEMLCVLFLYSLCIKNKWKKNVMWKMWDLVNFGDRRHHFGKLW